MGLALAVLQETRQLCLLVNVKPFNVVFKRADKYPVSYGVPIKCSHFSLGHMPCLHHFPQGNCCCGLGWYRGWGIFPGWSRADMKFRAGGLRGLSSTSICWPCWPKVVSTHSATLLILACSLEWNGWPGSVASSSSSTACSACRFPYLCFQL